MYGEHLNQDAEIRVFTENDCEACQAIWLACFPEDTPEAPEHFFRDVLHRGEGLVYQAGGRPVSMVFMLPAELVGEDGRLPIQYIYAAATHPDYQHRGIFAALLRGALDRAAKQGMAASFLHPGEPGLIGYYAGFGYQPFFTVSRRVLTAATEEKTAAGKWKSVSADAYTTLRRKYLSQRNGEYVDWPERLVAYAASMAESMGGGAVADEKGNCALCEPRDGRLFVHELLCPEICREEAVRELLGRFGCCKAEVLSPPTAEKEVYGLWCPLSGEGDKRQLAAREPYMGMALE